MAGTVKLPVIGQVKTTWVWVGGLAVVGIVGYAYIRHRNTAAASSSSGYDTTTADTTAADLSGTSDIDPATGLPYDEESALSDYGAYGDYGAGFGGGFFSPGPASVAGGIAAVPSVIGASQANAISAIQGAGLIPFPSSVESGMGNVISQSPAAGSQVDVGTTVYWQPEAGTGSTGGGGGSGHAVNPVSGLHVTRTGYTSVGVAWHAARGATGYEVTVTGPSAPPPVHVTGTGARIGSLERKKHYDIKVRAQPGGTGGTDAHVGVTTK